MRGVFSLAAIAVALSSACAGAAVAEVTLDAEWARRQELQQLQAVAEHNRQVRAAAPAETQAQDQAQALDQAQDQAQAQAAAVRDGGLASLGVSTAAFADTDTDTDVHGTAGLNRRAGFRAAIQSQDFVAQSQAFGPAIAFAGDDPAAFRLTTAERRAFATSDRDLWVEGEGFSDRLRVTTRGTLRRADGAPLPPTSRDLAALDVHGYDVRYTRGFTAARGYTASGLEVSLTPHAGFGVGDRGGSAEAGATLRIGQNLDKMVRDGSEVFGQRARWYLYAAGSGRAVGYNFARNRDGDYARSGYSHDSGAFLGDASIGVAWRRGAVQSSFGVVYREVEAEGLRGEGIDTDVSEGLVAFQLSLKPEW